MIWVILTALAAVCGAAKLDTKYLPPLSARTAGGSAGALLAPLDGSQGLPTGSYTNDAQGVVVDAVNPGTRTSGLEATGLGGPRTSYGSKDSKVGDAAFGVFSLGSGLSRIAPGFGSFVESDERQADKASGNSLKFGSDVGLDNYSGFETDNGISVGANGEAAVGVKAQGSYDAQKHKDEGDNSSNGVGINNGKLTIGGGDATSSGSYVSQSGKRPTSGILVGSFTPGSVGSFSSQGHSAQGSGEVSGNKQSSFEISKDQSVSQGFTVLGGSSLIGGQIGQADSKDSDSVSHDHLSSQTGSSQSTETRFGVQTTKSEGSHAHAHATAGSPVRSPSFQSGASAYSSAVTKGSGSASAFASSAPFGSGLKNEYLPPLSSFGSVGQHTHGSISGSGSSAGESFTVPSTATASASVSGSQTQEQGPDNSYYYKKPSQPFTIPTVVSSGQHSVHRQPNVPASSISQQVSKYPNTPATVATGQYQGTSSSSYNGITQASISKFPSGSSSSSTQFNSQSSQFGSKPLTQLGQTSQQTSPQFVSTETHSGPKVQGQTQFVQTDLQVPIQSGSTETHFGHQTSQTSGSSQLPSQQNQGTIYQYNRPATTQSTFQQTQTGSNVQSSFGQKPILSSQVSGSKYQFGSFGSQFNQKPVKTQGSIVSSNTNTQSQTSLVQKPIVSSQTTTQFGSQFAQTGQQAPTQSGSTETHLGHQTTQTADNSQSPSQQNQGTIYQYNKPTTTQYNKPATTQSTFQQTQTGSNVQSSFGQKPIVGSQVSGSKYQFGSFVSQFNQKPVKTQGSIVSSNTNTQSQTSFVQKPIVSSQTTTQFGSQFVQTGQQAPTQSGSTETHLGHQTTQTADNSQSPSQQNQGTIYQYNKPTTTQYNKPATTQSTFQQTQTGSNVQSSFGQKPIVSSQVSGSKYQFGSFGSQFNQKPVKTIVSSNTNTQTSLVQKPIVSSQTTTQFGSKFVQTGQQAPTQSGSTTQTTQTSDNSQSPSQQNQGTIYQYNKPATTQSTFQQTQTGSNVQSSFGQKPIVSSQISGSKYQFGSFGSQFNQKPIKTQGSIVSSNTNTQSQTSLVQKPIVSSQTTTQFGSQFVQTGQQAPTQSGSTTQTSDNSQSPSQQNQGTIYQYNKPATTQSTFQQTQTGSNVQSSFGQKPIVGSQVSGSKYQFGSFGSQFNQKPVKTQGSIVSSNKNTLSSQAGSQSSLIGTSYLPSKIGSSGSQFGQNVQSSLGAGLVSTTATPAFGSSYKPTEFVFKPSTTKDSSYTYTQSQISQSEKKPVVSTTQTQFGSSSKFGQNSQSSSIGTSYQPSKIGSSGSQFGQNVQSSLGAGLVSTTATPAFGSSYKPTEFVFKPSTTKDSSYTYTQSQISQSEKKPVVSTTQTQFGSSSKFGQNSQSSLIGTSYLPSKIGSSGSQFGQNVQSSLGAGLVSTTAKPAFGSSYKPTEFVFKPSTTKDSSYTYTQSQISQSEKKPVVSTTQTQFGSSSKFGQNSQSSSIGTSYQPSKIGSSGSQFGQNVQSSLGAGLVSTTAKPAFGSSYKPTEFVFKPSTTKDSSYTYTQSQISQSEKKPVVSTTQTQFGSSSKFGQNPQSSSIGTSYQPSKIGSSGSQFGQNVQSSLGAGLVSTTAKPAFGFPYKPTEFVFKPSTTKDSSYTYTQSQISQSEKKPVVSTMQTQFGSSSKFGQNSQSSSIGTSYLPSKIGSSGSQFGQNVQSSLGAGLVSTTAKPAFGSSYKPTEFVFKPSTTKDSSYTYTQSQISQSEKKPVVSTTQTQFGSSSKFGQNSQSSSIGTSYQPSKIGSSGSQFGQNTQASLGAGLVSTTAKPAFGSSYKPTEFVFKPSTTKDSSYTYTQSQISQSEKKPVVSTTQTQFGSSSKFGQNSQSSLIGTSYQPSKIGFSGAQFGQNTQASLGAGLVSTTAKPAFGSSYKPTEFVFKPSTIKDSSYTYTQSQISQSEKEPVVSTTQTQFGSSSKFGQNSQSSSIGTSYLPSKIGSSGSQFGQNTQASLGAGLVSTTAKPAFGSSYKPTEFVFKPSTTKDSSYTYTQSQISQSEKKPVVSTTQTQFGSSSKFGQNSQSSLIGTSYQPSKIGSSGSQFGQNTQSSLGAKGSGLTSTTSQTSFGIKPVYQQTQFGSFGSQNSQASQFAKKPVTITTTGVTSQQLSGSKVSQHTQSTDEVGSVSVTTPSRVGESSQTIVPISTISQNVEPSQFGQKPIQAAFGSSTTHFGQKPQAHPFASSSGSNVVPFSSTQTGQVSKYETSQFGVQNQGVVSSTQKPLGSSLSQTNYQQYQYTQTGGKSGSQPQFGKGSQSNVGSGQTTFGAQSQKPFGSTQTTYQPTQYFTQGQKPFGSSQGSTFQIVGQSIGEQPTQGTVPTSSVPGYKYPNAQSVFTTQFGSQSSGAQDQKVQQSQTNFNSAVSTSQTPINGQPLKPFGVPSTQSTFQQSQSTVSSSQFGVQAVKPTGFTAPVIQTSYNKNSGKPFQPASTVSPQGSNVQSQFSVVSTPQFGVQNQGVVSSTQKPVGSSLSQTNYQQYQYTQTGDKYGSQSQFSKGSESNVGSGQIGQTLFGVQAQKPFASTQTNYKQTQFTQGQKPFGSSQGSTFQIVGQSIGEQPTQGTVPTSSVPGYKYPNAQSVFTTQFGSQSNGAQDQKVQQSQTNFNSAVSTSQTPINGQPLKPFGVPSTQSTFQQSQSTVSSSKFGVQAVKPTGFTAPVIQTSYNKNSGKPFQPASTVSPQGSNVQSQFSVVSTPQFGVQNQGVVSSTQKPVGSSLSQTNYQQYQYKQTGDKSGSQSQFGKGSESNIGSGQIGQTLFGVQAQKPFASTQTNYKQTQFTQGQKPFGSSQGSTFQIVGSSVGQQPTQGTVQTSSVSGYKYPKPQSVFNAQFEGQSNSAQDQKVQQSQTNFNSAVSTSQTPINGQPLKPFGVPSTQSTFQQSQSTVSSSKFGVQAVKPTGFTAPVIQTSYNKNSGKPFQPASIVSTQGSNVQSQSSAVSSSQFGVQPTPSTEIAHFSGRPEFSILPSNGIALNPSVFSSTQAPSRVGSNEGLVVSTVQTPIESVPGYELVIKEENSADHEASHALVGLGEQFGGPRDPPRFDEDTGYYY